MTHEMEDNDLDMFEDEQSAPDVTGMDQEDLHSLIHRLTAEALVAGLSDPETRVEAAVLNAALRFLKDNGVEIEPKPGSKVKDVESHVHSLPFTPAVRKAQA